MAFRVAFMGRGRSGYRVLEGLLENPEVEVPLVMTCRHTPEVGMEEGAFEKCAAERGIPFLRTNRIDRPEALALLRGARAELAVAMNWVYVIGAEPMGTVRRGFLNMHGGLLPRYRGNACQSWAILNGESEIGISVHWMDPGELDSGPVLLQERVPIRESTSVGELYDAVVERGAELVLEAVEQIRTGRERPVPQDAGAALRCYPRLPRDGEIDWQQPADAVARLVRAAGAPYPGAYSYFADVRDGGRIKRMTVCAARAEDHPGAYCAVPGHLLRIAGGKRWAVVCGDRRLLALERIEIDGEPFAPGEFFRTVRQRFGLDTATLLGEIRRLEGLLGGR